MIGNKLHKTIATRSLFLMNFLLGAHIALVVYFNSNFLESRGISEDYLGMLYIAGSVISVIILYFLPKILKRFGNYKTVLFSTITEMIMFVGIAFCPCVYALMLMFAISIASSVPLFFGFDIFLKSFSDKDKTHTGDNRSSFLTALNIAFVSAPFLAGQILDGNEDYALIYLISASLLFPVIYILIKEFRNFKDLGYQSPSIKPTVKKILSSLALRNIFIVQFIIRFFFSWMVIYTPVYLTQHIGLSLPQVGVVFSIMLIPFVLLEYPLGHFIDNRIGEKEILILGFIILALSTATISSTVGTDLVTWIIVLVSTRIGAAMIEVMNEIYFFKHVHSDDLDTIGAFRVLRPLAYIIGPAVGTISLIIMPMKFLFLALSAIVLIGLFATLRLKDTID